MTKAQLVSNVHAKAKDEIKNIKKEDVEKVINDVFGEIRMTIAKEGRFSLPRFGTFNVTHRKARRGVNPQTGADIRIPASESVRFSPAPTMRALLPKP